ncbi:hypothetical protein L843_4177 [Mycobacterium intracellulare MIN_061107_1834]|nr:hypothetical protein L843_4177 [Mycobacterium intracellulare MIN_061107_1834]
MSKMYSAPAIVVGIDGLPDSPSRAPRLPTPIGRRRGRRTAQGGSGHPLGQNGFQADRLRSRWSARPYSRSP